MLNYKSGNRNTNRKIIQNS